MVLLAAACEQVLPHSHSCTEKGCQDGVNITIRPTAGLLAPGVHDVDITAGGNPVHCTFELPQGGPPSNFTTATCNGGVSVFVQARVTCRTVSSGNAVSQICDPIPGQFEERITIPGTPSAVRIVERAAGTIVIDRELTPSYQDTRPNGPDCEPLCRQASNDLVI